MDDRCTYHVEVQGQIDENDVNATSPLRMTVDRIDEAATLFTTYADQSALIGLMRYLHGRGFVLLSVYRER